MERIQDKSLYKLVFLALLFLAGSVHAKPPGWFTKLNQIKLLESTRQEVEKNFGDPQITQQINGEFSRQIEYKLPVGSLTVSYSIGKCSPEKNTTGYDVDEDVVIRIYLLLFKDVKISDLKVDLSGFERYQESDSNAISYYNYENGIEFTGGKKTIRSIEYSIGDKYDYLDCENVLKSPQK